MSSDTPRRSPLVHVGHPESHIPLFDPPDEPSKPLSHAGIVIRLVIGLALAATAWFLEHYAVHELPGGIAPMTPNVALPWVIPFALLLACIAAMPFIARHFWEHNYPYIAIALGLIVAVYYLTAGFHGSFHHGAKALSKSMAEYISFIFLLGSLYVVSGGILIRVRRRATPAVNTGLLLVGAIIANVFGTTGASMLLIRPFLRMNKGHIRPYHVVFFIFIVSNLGGALTPIGDPPLFLGYLKGVPFWWVAEHCWQAWAVGVGALAAIFFLVDTLSSRKETRAEHAADGIGPAVSIFGAGNILYIAMILVAVFLHPPFREGLMVLAACLSLWTTPRRIHQENVFNFAPIREVALLFVGIFATMVPALNYLAIHANDPEFAKNLRTPGQFYYATGTLSSVLDNAPTYLTFLETELSKTDPELIKRVTAVANDPKKFAPDEDDLAGLDETQRAELVGAVDALRRYHGDKLVKPGTLRPEDIKVAFLLGNEKLNWYIVAISLGAVFFGAMTYIGNGPNFMVKSIAENAGVKCPSFFGYVFRYSIPILLPVLILVWLIFLFPHSGH